MSFLIELTAGFCGGDVEDEDEEDQIDFCGMPSDQIVETAIRRDFLLLRLQALVDAETLQEAEAALVAMEKEAGRDKKLLRFLVRAGTVDIIRGSKLLGGVGQETTATTKTITPTTEVADGACCDCATPLVSRSVAADSLLKKLLPYHEQRRLRKIEKERRVGWGMMIMSG
jgi:hypothetical protein